MKKIKITVEKTATGFSAYASDYPGVVSVGHTWEDIQIQFKEAFVLHIEGMAEDGEAVPTDYTLEFCLDIPQFFQHYKVFNVTALANYLGLNPQLLHQYKDGHKQVSGKTSKKIIAGLHHFADELLSTV